MYKCIVAVFLVLSACCVSAQVERYKDTMPAGIPPGVLRLYNRGVIDRSRPKVVTIDRPMIESLVRDPDLGGDVYSFDFDVRDLSPAEKNILLGWVRRGNNILLWGSADMWKYVPLFSDKVKIAGKPGLEVTLAKHPVNNDVEDITFKGKSNSYVYLFDCPTGTEIIAYMKNNIVAGKFPYGKGSVYFAGVGEYWYTGKDKDRWTLNFYQWMLGLPVPGKAATLF